MCALTTPYEVVLKHAEMIPDQTALTFGIVPSPAATSSTVIPGRCGDAATSTTPSKPTSDGTPTPTRCHGNDLQLPYHRSGAGVVRATFPLPGSTGSTRIRSSRSSLIRQFPSEPRR